MKIWDSVYTCLKRDSIHREQKLCLNIVVALPPKPPRLDFFLPKYFEWKLKTLLPSHISPLQFLPSTFLTHSPVHISSNSKVGRFNRKILIMEIIKHKWLNRFKQCEINNYFGLANNSQIWAYSITDRFFLLISSYSKVFLVDVSFLLLGSFIQSVGKVLCS